VTSVTSLKDPKYMVTANCEGTPEEVEACEQGATAPPEDEPTAPPEDEPTAPPEDEPMQFTGVVYDNKCWNGDGHVGLDGVNVETDALNHHRYCMFDIGVCVDSGFMLLESYTDAGATKYRPKYQLDEGGKAMVMKLGEYWKSKDWERIDTEVQVYGTVLASDASVNAQHRPGLAATSEDIMVVTSVTSLKDPKYMVTANCEGTPEEVEACEQGATAPPEDDASVLGSGLHGVVLGLCLSLLARQA